MRDYIFRENLENSKDLLIQMVDRILSCGHPDRIYLFGSFARNEQNEKSDLDIFIIEESDEPRYKRSPKYYLATSGIFPRKDIVVWTQNEVDQWKSVKNSLPERVLSEGKLLYER